MVAVAELVINTSISGELQPKRTSDNRVVTSDSTIRLGMWCKKKSFTTHPDSYCRCASTVLPALNSPKQS
jgi:hypothetical protein